MAKAQGKKAAAAAKGRTKPTAGNRKAATKASPKKSAAPAKKTAAKKAARPAPKKAAPAKAAVKKAAPKKPAPRAAAPAKKAAAPKKPLPKKAAAKAPAPKKAARAAVKPAKAAAKPAARTAAKAPKATTKKSVAAEKPTTKPVRSAAAGVAAAAKVAAKVTKKAVATVARAAAAGARKVAAVAAPAAPAPAAVAPAAAPAKEAEKKRGRRARPRVMSHGAPAAAWLTSEKPRPASFIPAPARAEAPSAVAAPPASSDRLLRPEDVDHPAVRTVPVRIDIEQGAGRFYVIASPQEVSLKSGEGIEWDFRYIGGADVSVEEVAVEFAEPSPFAQAKFRTRKPGGARPHRQLSGAVLPTAAGKRIEYSVRAISGYDTDLASTRIWMTVTG